MSALSKKISIAGEFIFLGAVALLIVRANSYSWPLKRASDILFFLSLLTPIFYLLTKKDSGIFNQEKFRKSFIGLALILFGLIIASISVFLLDGQKIESGGILEISRFLEAGIILLLCGFFQNFDGKFYQKAAIAQLSTLTYFLAFFMPNLYLTEYRFQLWENWPSNVGYYLVVSLSLTGVWFLRDLKKEKRTFFLWYIIAIGLTAILLWTQARAAWLGIATSLIFISFSIFRNNFKKIALGLSLIALLPILGFFILPTYIQNLVIGRLYPQVINTPNINTISIKTTLNKAIANKFSPQIDDPRRIFLWGRYLEELSKRPFGLGVDFNPLPLVGAIQGPHNTVLEILEFSGLFGLAGFIYLIYLGFKNIFEGINGDEWKIYIAGALIGVLVVSLFDDLSTFRLLWLILGIAIFAIPSRTNEAS